MTPFMLLVALGIGTAVVTATVMRSRDGGSTTPPAAPATPPTAHVPPSPVSGKTPTSPEQAARTLRSVRRHRRRSLVGSVTAGVVLGLATGAFPVALWVDSRTVPAGAETTEVTVEGYVTGTTALRSGARPSARTVQVTPAVDGRDRVTLEYRWLWPDAGDALEVYPEDGGLRATEEAGALHLVGAWRWRRSGPGPRWAGCATVVVRTVTARRAGNAWPGRRPNPPPVRGPAGHDRPMFDIAIWTIVALGVVVGAVIGVRGYLTGGPDGGRDPGLTADQRHAIRMQEHHAKRDAKRAAKAAEREERERGA
ncbi:hypothetical protein G7072_16360 [Nocardioides sp. HDW12B]|uniref:hypothetical protein n=1 Tax=Nocardioides sp. HDW12B TaxID=2714939 RepID=UPI001407830C|nr:hypothetical protein [Nocardioides sp. HDW12B]QIK67710.1 hypothetical protein G7072_16360 [Nocardioides sp. HDW12B]